MWFILIILAALAIYFNFFYDKGNKKKQVNWKPTKQTKNQSNETNQVANSWISQKEIDELDPYYKLNQKIYDKNPDQLNIPNIVKLGRTKNKGKRLSELHNEYFSGLPLFIEKKTKLISEMIDLIDDSLQLIEPFIIYEKKKWGSFDIKSIPLIENALLYYSALGYNEKVKDVYKLIVFFPELEFYKVDAENAVKFCSIVPDLMNFINEKQGITVKDLKPDFEKDFELIKNNLYYLAKFGVLKKSKIKNYNFYEIN